MTRIFVYEYLSSGGDPAANDDLLSMGQSMRDALVADLVRLDDCEVSVAACGPAKTPIGPARMVKPRERETPFDFVARHALANDLVWVVAPETDGVLVRLAQRVDPARWLGCDIDSIRLTSGKRATLARLAEAGVWTPLAFEHAPEIAQWVVKPDDGAGSIDTRVHASFEAATRDRANRSSHAGHVGHVGHFSHVSHATTIEPWVEGQALSLSLLYGAQHTELLSINCQHLSINADGSVSFCGVAVNAVPLDDPRAATLRDLAASVGTAIAGLRGFVGVDLVWHAQRGPVVIEVNPRLTCAYVGLSSALGRNVASDIIAAHQRLHDRSRETAHGDA